MNREAGADCPDRAALEVGDQRAKLREHLAVCATCRNVVEHIEAQRDDLGTTAPGLAAFASTVAATPDSERPRSNVAPPAFTPGQRIGDRYLIEARVGAGGMGVVYRALDEKLGELVALKVMRGRLVDETLFDEVRVAQKVTHANVCRIYDLVAIDNYHFIKMEFVAGETLSTRLGRDGPLPIADAIRIARDVARGLVAAHAKGIVHRDLKPSNVMLAVDRAVLMDFGLARSLSHAVEDGSGTPGYMAPEQITTGKSDERADLYALGCVVYQMLTGKLVFEASTPVDVVAKHVTTTPPDVRVARADTPKWLARAVAQLLAKGPVVRPKGLETILSPRRGKQLRWLAPVVGGLLCIGVVWEAFIHGASTEPTAPPSANSVANSSTMKATTLSDLPLPSSRVPDAITEYKTGLQALRDDGYDSARKHFERATNLDPEMAVGHLRLAMTDPPLPEVQHREVAKATELRAQLSERDRMLLDAIEPVLGRAQPDPGVAIDRMRAAHQRFPLDEEIVKELCKLTLGDPVDGSKMCGTAVDLDPDDAEAWEILGRSKALAGDLVAGRRALETCANKSIESSDCYLWMANLDNAQGRCAEMEEDAQHAVDHDPKGGNLYLVEAAGAQARPESFLRELVARHVAEMPGDVQGLESLRLEVRLAIASARFDVAIREVRQMNEIIASSPSYRANLKWPLMAATQQIELLLEIGDESAARSVAHEFVERIGLVGEHPRIGLVDSAHPWTSEQNAWRVLRVANVPLDPERNEWADRQLRAGAPGTVVWVSGWASPSQTAKDAIDAVDALTSDPRLRLANGGEIAWSSSDSDGATGHALLLAGRPAEAVSYLARMVASCNKLIDPFGQIHAQLDLGRASEQLGKPKDACAAYNGLLAQWGHANPKSVSADEARARVKALGCTSRSPAPRP